MGSVIVDIGYVFRCSESETEQILGRTHKILVFTLRTEDNGRRRIQENNSEISCSIGMLYPLANHNLERGGSISNTYTKSSFSSIFKCEFMSFFQGGSREIFY